MNDEQSALWEMNAELAMLELEQASAAFVEADNARNAAWQRFVDAVGGAAGAVNRVMGRTS